MSDKDSRKNAGDLRMRRGFRGFFSAEKASQRSRFAAARLSAALGLLLITPIFPGTPVSQDTHVLTTLSGVAVEASARAFVQGEAVAFTVREAPEKTRIVVSFLDKTLELNKPGTENNIGLLGIDLAAKPGIYPWTIRTENESGHWEESRMGVMVEARNFPVRRLRVAQEYVTPPASVQERIRREADLLAAVYAMPSPVWMGDGAFILPHGGRSADNFGERRIFNDVPRSPHTGLDIAAPMGDPVRASNAGRVVMASDLYFSGKTVIIDHGLGVFSLYCHFSKLLVKRTQMVAKGETIGLIGSTGRSTGPHLHWGFRIYDSRVDPISMTALPLD